MVNELGEMVRELLWWFWGMMMNCSWLEEAIFVSSTDGLWQTVLVLVLVSCLLLECAGTTVVP